MKTVLTLLLLLISFNISAITYPAIHESRPRIWADSARFAWLRSNLTSGECGSTYTDFRYRYDHYWITDPQLYLAGSDSSLWTWTWSSQYAANEAVFTAFIYRLTDEPLMLKRCIFILNRFIHTIDTIHFQNMEWYTKETLLRGMSDAGGTILDWVYPSLPSEKRQRLAQCLFRLNREFMATYILSSAGTSYVSSHNAYNCVQTMQNAIVLYNAEGLNQNRRDSVVQWFNSVYDKWENGFFPCYGYYRSNNGGWNWGAAYAMWSLTDQFKLFDNMLFGTTKNYYNDLPWVLNSINQYWYFIQPNNSCIHLGDGVMNLWADNVVYRHASVYQDQRSMWLAQTYSQPQYLGWTYPVFIKLLDKDFSLPAVSKPDPPHFWLSDRVGLSVARTSWDSAGTMVWFFNSRSKKASHEHRDNNSFAVYRNGPLLLDAGFYDSYGSSHFMNYYTRTIAHNNVCVFDTTDLYFYGSTTPVSNDGGQIWSDPLQNYSSIFDPHFQRGRWIQYAEGAGYQYSAADAALSFDSAKVKRCVRRLLYMLPDNLIVLDHLTINNPGHRTRKVQWMLHSKEQPVMGGPLISAPVPGHLEVFGGSDCFFSNGSGNAAVRTLIPPGTRTRRIGGTGWEYWVNGTNYPPSVQPDTLYSTPGKWRIEVTPQEMSDTMVLLHTVKLGDQNSPAVCGGTGKQNAFTVGCDWEDRLYFFNASGIPEKSYHRMDNVSGGRTADVFAADLKPSAVFYILCDSAMLSQSSTDTSGIMTSSIVLPPGLHRVEITDDPVTSISEGRGGIKIFRLRPNPATGYFEITPGDGYSHFRMRMIDEKGDLIRSQVIKKASRISTSGLSTGRYFIVADENGMMQTEILLIRNDED